MHSDTRTVALLGLERDEAAFSRQSLAEAQAAVDPLAAALETAALFADVQTVAATEERRRIAREIHDGIAQELASLGYAIDEVLADAGDAKTIAALRGLRQDTSRLIGELRLSLFDLRSDVSGRVSLGSALSDYARSVGTAANLRVQLVLDENGRLPVAAESELLRIAQEAITNARRHAQATTLWVELAVEPPDAILRISDDGLGLQKGRNDSFGIGIMRERASRINATLALRPRKGGGTVVEVALGTTTKRQVDAAHPPTTSAVD